MDRYPEDEVPPRREYDDAVAAGLVEIFDPYPRFRDQLASIVDLERIRAAGRKVLVEPMWGSGSGWFTRLLDGGNLTIRELHTERNPFFGGVNPEPIRPNIDEWLAEIPRWGADIGIAFDGDADRVGMATEEGVFVNQLQVYGLLYWYLLEVRGRIGPAVYTVTTTSMVRRLAERYGTEAYETGVGFKFVGPKMEETAAEIGGEESGGFGFGMHIPERDGLAAGLFLLDLWLSRGAPRLRGPGRAPGPRRAVVLQPDRRPLLARGVPGHQARHACPPRERGADRPRRPGGRPTPGTRHRRRLQVLPRRRVVAPDPVQRDRGPAPHLCRGRLSGGRRDDSWPRDDGSPPPLPRPRERAHERRPRLLRLQASRRGPRSTARRRRRSGSGRAAALRRGRHPRCARGRGTHRPRGHDGPSPEPAPPAGRRAPGGGRPEPLRSASGRGHGGGARHGRLGDRGRPRERGRGRSAARPAHRPARLPPAVRRG